MAVGISAEADLILATTAIDCLVVSEEDDDEVDEDEILTSEDDEVLVNDVDKVLVNEGTKVLVADCKRSLTSTISDWIVAGDKSEYEEDEVTTWRETLVSEDNEVLVKAGMVLMKEGVKDLATDSTIDLNSPVSDLIFAREWNEEVKDDKVMERGILVYTDKEVLADEGDKVLVTSNSILLASKVSDWIVARDNNDERDEEVE